MDTEKLTEYADYLLQCAMYKVHNLNDAGDLVQETFLAALTAMEKGERENVPFRPDNLRGWLVTVLDRKYYDLLRRKYRRPTVSIDLVQDFADGNDISEALEKTAFYGRQRPEARRKLRSFFAVRAMCRATYNIRDQVCGGQEPFANYPDRPLGGKWYALGNRYPAGFDYASRLYAPYNISGEVVKRLCDCCGLFRTGSAICCVVTLFRRQCLSR